MSVTAHAVADNPRTIRAAVATPSPLLYRLLRGGQEAAITLQQSGLLRDGGTFNGRTVDACPATAQDVLKVAASPRGVVLLGLLNGTVVGYIVAQIHEAERGETHLFIRQAVGSKHPAWNREAMVFFEETARSAGFDAVAIILPTRISKAFAKRYGFEMVGVHEVKRLNDLKADQR